MAIKLKLRAPSREPICRGLGGITTVEVRIAWMRTERYLRGFWKCVSATRALFPVFVGFVASHVSAVPVVHERSIFQREAHEQSLSFIAPNELNFEEIEPTLRLHPGDTYMAVGTFRAWHGFSVSPARRAWFVDRDPNVVRWNRAFRILIRESHDHHDLLRRLLKGSQLDGLFNELEAGRIGLSQIMDEALHHRVNRFPHPNWWPSMTFASAHTYTLDPFHSWVDAIAEVLAKGVVRPTFLTSEELFQRLKVRLDQVSVLPADLAGSRALMELGRALRSEGATVGVLDISNVELLPQSHDSVPGLVSTREVERWLRNISGLPWHPDGIVISTRARRGTAHEWDYRAIPAASLLAERHAACHSLFSSWWRGRASRSSAR